MSDAQEQRLEQAWKTGDQDALVRHIRLKLRQGDLVKAWTLWLDLKASHPEYNAIYGGLMESTAPKDLHDYRPYGQMHREAWLNGTRHARARAIAKA